MITRVPKTKGRGVGKSFNGTAAYLLHDEGKAKTADRVLWTETLNLGVDDPELAARVMAATAKDADRLKRAHHESEQAKLPEDERTPYKASKASKNHVFHYSLAWDGENEGHTLTRDEMIRAAKGSLRALEAETLQAVLVAHESKTNPHVHVMLNRVDPETGYTRTPESNAQYRLSEWALKYERERGFVLCKERELNAARREAELPYVQYRPEARKAYEARMSAAAEIERNPEGAERVRDAQIDSDRALGRETREMRETQRKDWQQLGIRHRERKKAINDEADRNKGYAERVIKQSYVPRFDEMRARHETERETHAERETRLAGKLRNVVDAVKHIHATRGEAQDGILRQTFDVLGNSGARLQMLKRAQAAAEKTMNGQMKQEIGAALRDLENARGAAIHGNYERYGTDKAAMIDTHDEQRQANRAAWEQRDTERLKAWRDFSAQTKLEQDYANAAGQLQAERGREDDERSRQHSQAEETTKTVGEAFGSRNPAQAQPEARQEPQQGNDRGRERTIDDS